MKKFMKIFATVLSSTIAITSISDIKVKADIVGNGYAVDTSSINQNSDFYINGQSILDGSVHIDNGTTDSSSNKVYFADTNFENISNKDGILSTDRVYLSKEVPPTSSVTKTVTIGGKDYTVNLTPMQKTDSDTGQNYYIQYNATKNIPVPTKYLNVAFTYNFGINDGNAKDMIDTTLGSNPTLYGLTDSYLNKSIKVSDAIGLQKDFTPSGNSDGSFKEFLYTGKDFANASANRSNLYLQPDKQYTENKLSSDKVPMLCTDDLYKNDTNVYSPIVDLWGYYRFYTIPQYGDYEHFTSSRIGRQAPLGFEAGNINYVPGSLKISDTLGMTESEMNVCYDEPLSSLKRYPSGTKKSIDVYQIQDARWDLGAYRYMKDGSTQYVYPGISEEMSYEDLCYYYKDLFYNSSPSSAQMADINIKLVKLGTITRHYQGTFGKGDITADKKWSQWNPAVNSSGCNYLARFYGSFQYVFGTNGVQYSYTGTETRCLPVYRYEGTVTVPTDSKHSLTVTANPSSGGTVGINGTSKMSITLSKGETATIQQNANSDYTFNNWTGDVINLSGTTVTMQDSDITLTANYKSNIPNPPVTYKAPVAHIDAPSEVHTGTPVTVSGYGIDPQGLKITDYQWTCSTGDTITGTGGTINITGDSATVTLKVKNEKDLWSEPVTAVIGAINHPPTVYLSAPGTVIMGDDVAINAYGSDPDGDKLQYTWNTPGGFIGSCSNASGTGYFSSVGTKSFSVTVTDPFGASGSDFTTVNVIAPMPNIIIDKSGTEKENRKITLNTEKFSSGGSKRFPIDWTTAKWEFFDSNGNKLDVDSNPTTSTLVKSLDSTTGTKLMNIIIKKQGAYKVRCTASNTAGYTNYTDILLNIVPDIVPVADFNLPGTGIRVPSDLSPNGKAQFTTTLTDNSSSIDQDVIAKRMYVGAWDSDNDGSYIWVTKNEDGTTKATPTYEHWYVYDLDYDGSTDTQQNGLSDSLNPHWRYVGNYNDAKALNIDIINCGNLLSVQFKSTSVGRYDFEESIKEGFGQETIPELITNKDRKQASSWGLIN